MRRCVPGQSFAWRPDVAIRSETARERRRVKAREYARKHAAANRERAKARVYEWRARARKRGVLLKRLREPKSLAAWSGQLRWERPTSSNGDWRPSTAWDALQVYGDPSRLRRLATWADRGMHRDAAARWLRENDQRRGAPEAAADQAVA